MTFCRSLMLAGGLALLAGCSSFSGNYPRNAPLLPSANLNLSATNVIPLENLAYGAAGAALLYFIYDPLAPNWEIAEARLADDTYRLSMKLKRFHRGGDGEAVMIFKRRADELRAQGGHAGYEIVDFVEGIESSTPLAQRFSEGVIRLVKAAPPAEARAPAAKAR